MTMNEKYINPFTDFGFKKLFGSEFNKDLLIDFLNQVLGEREQIKDLTYLNPEQLGNAPTDRKAVFDLYCESSTGEKFIIEFQNVPQQFFKDRSLFYATFPIQEQAVKGSHWDYNLKAVYTIGILNFSFADTQERYLREIRLIDRQTGEVFYDKLTFIYLEVPRFRKAEAELVTHFDKWMFVLKNLHRLQGRPKKLQEKVFEKLFTQAEIARLNPEDMKTYEESLKTYWDNYSVLQTARNEGKEEGKQEGLLEVAREMRKNNEPVEKIMKYTGLTREQIEKL
jgi:predicted transposase/invertase (TIGR01784 family)